MLGSVQNHRHDHTTVSIDELVHVSTSFGPSSEKNCIACETRRLNGVSPMRKNCMVFDTQDDAGTSLSKNRHI